MLKIVANVGGRATLFLGIDRANTERLHADMPIKVNAEELLEPTSMDKVQDVVLVAGETVADLIDQLRRGGMPIPEDVPAEGEYRRVR